MLLSLMALYNHDNTILSDDYLNLPEDVNHETMVMRLLIDLAELEILIPNPDVLKQAIKFWSLSRLSQWERMVLALSEEYNPLHNYDRYEEWEDTDTGTGSATDTKTGSATDTKTGSGQTGHNSTLTKAGTVTTAEEEGVDTSESGTSQEDVAGFNSSSYTPKSKTTGSSTGSSDRELDSTVTTAGTDTLAETGTSSNTENGTSSSTVTDNSSSTETVTHSNTDSKTGAHEGHLYGNIGVTTSMQMLTEELKGRQTDIYQIIVDEFKRQFCLMVY